MSVTELTNPGGCFSSRREHYSVFPPDKTDWLFLWCNFPGKGRKLAIHVCSGFYLYIYFHMSVTRANSRTLGLWELKATQHPSPGDIFVTTDGPTRTHHNHSSPRLMLGVTLVVGVPSTGLDKCVMTRIHRYGTQQHRFIALKVLCAPDPSLFYFHFSQSYYSCLRETTPWTHHFKILQIH